MHDMYMWAQIAAAQVDTLASRALRQLEQVPAAHRRAKAESLRGQQRVAVPQHELRAGAHVRGSKFTYIHVHVHSL